MNKLYEEIYDTDYDDEITHQFSYFGKKQTILSIAAASPGVGPSGPDPSLLVGSIPVIDATLRSCRVGVGETNERYDRLGLTLPLYYFKVN